LNNFKICNKCKAVNAPLLVEKIRKLAQDANIELGCVNACGIGMRKPFVILNDIFISADNLDELFEKIKEKIKK